LKAHNSNREETATPGLAERIAWFKRRARRAQYFYNASRLCLVVLSAALPALISYNVSENGRLLSIIISVAIAVLAGLDAQFRPGEQWRHHRSTQLALMRLRRAYEHLEADTNERAQAFEKFFGDVESLLAAEANQYWAFRIIEWQSREAKP
jgi:hypothetical protein